MKGKQRTKGKTIFRRVGIVLSLLFVDGYKNTLIPIPLPRCSVRPIFGKGVGQSGNFFPNPQVVTPKLRFTVLQQSIGLTALPVAKGTSFHRVDTPLTGTFADIWGIFYLALEQSILSLCITIA